MASKNAKQQQQQQEQEAPPENLHHEALQAIQEEVLTFVLEGHREQFDKALTKFEERTQLKREQVNSMYSMNSLLNVGAVFVGVYLVFGNFAQFLCNLIGFGYPAYASVKAIRTPNKEDDTQWLVYWTVFAFFSLVDSLAVRVLSIVPVYWLLKAVFLVFLHAPQTQGARVVYTKYVDPAVTMLDEYFSPKRVDAPADEKDE